MSANIFPPLLDSYQPAFVNTDQNYSIYFTLSGLSNINSIKNIQVKLVYQETNQSAVDTAKHPDDIIYYSSSNIGFLQDTNMYYIQINSSDLDGGLWKSGIYYRVQLRFGLSELYTNLSEFYTWKSEQVKQGYFSEWSTAMVLRPISQPTIEILNNQVFSSGFIINAVNVETNYMPTFFGRYTCLTYEPVDQYRFNLYDENGNQLETSGWLQYDISANTQISGESDIYSCSFQYRFKKILTNINEQKYQVTFDIKTTNLYEGTSEPYVFQIDVNPIPANNPFIITCYDSSNEPDSQKNRCNEEGVIDIHINSNGKQAYGNFVLVRSDERTNFTIWEDLTYLTYAKEEIFDTLVYSDYSIESGINYKYGIQYENQAGLRSDLVTEQGNPARQSNFQFSYLYRDGVQLKLKFDNTISSYKKTILVSKQDTLGSKYPTILKSGEAYYQEFTLSGLISLQMDDFYSFFTFKPETGYYYKDELVIPSNKYLKTYTEKNPNTGQDVPCSLFTFDNNLTDNNRYIERIFREKVEEFLNDTQPKLYKSATEGNSIVVLTNISFTPKSELNRMLYSFSATAYEIMDCTLENLIEYGINYFQEFHTKIENSKTFGQIRGFYTGEYSRSDDGDILYSSPSSPVNLVEEMQQQISSQVLEGGNDKFQQIITKVTAIWVESYPKINFNSQLIEKDALIAEQKNKGENADLDLILQYEQEKEEIEILKNEVEKSGYYPFYTLIINGQEIQLSENHVYNLNSVNLTSLTDIHLKYSGAIVLNYECETSTIENLEQVEYGNATVRVWNQIAGIFTDTDNILINYNYDANIGVDTLPLQEDMLPNYQIHNFTENNIGVYNTLNIMDVIKEKAIKEVQNTQNIIFTQKDINENGEEEWTDGQYYYTFSRLTSLSIEGEEGTPIYITNEPENNMESLSTVAYIGPTNKLVFKDIDTHMIKDIYLIDPQYVIVDFSAAAILTVKGTPTQSVPQEGVTL